MPDEKPPGTQTSDDATALESVQFSDPLKELLSPSNRFRLRVISVARRCAKRNAKSGEGTASGPPVAGRRKFK
jgi:hypothetical protein